MSRSAKDGKSVRHGYFLDPGRFRKALGDDVYDSLRYYEAAAEIVQEMDDAKAAKKFHRIVLLTEAVLFVLDIGRQEAKRDLWAGEGAHLPVMLRDVIAVTPLPKRSDIFAEDEINKTVRHFEVTYLVDNKRLVLELAAWESGSLLLNQIESAWISLQVRLCQGIPIEVRLDPDESQSLMHELYSEISTDIMTRQTSDPKKVLQSLGELADAALHDRELKRLFFTMPMLFHHLVNELQANRLPPRGLSNSSSTSSSQMRRADDVYTQNAGFLAGVPIARGKVSFSSRTQQLEYICAILRLMHCMLFNSQTVLDRSNVLTPTPLTFVELLQALSIQYDAKSVSRALHRLEVARVNATTVESPARDSASRQRRSSVESMASQMSTPTRPRHRQKISDGRGDDESDLSSDSDDDVDDDFGDLADDSDTNEAHDGGALGKHDDLRSDSDSDAESATRTKRPGRQKTTRNAASSRRGRKQQAAGSDAFDDNFQNAGSRSDANGKNEGTMGARSSGGGDLLRAISEYQVSVLLELDNVVTFAIWQGRSRAVVSETLATQLSKAGTEFTRHALTKIVRRFVELIERWRSMVLHPESTDRKALGSFAVRIYQHARLLQVLMLGNYRILRHILENSEEELRYYLFKTDFYGNLTDVPANAPHFKQIVVLNRISKGIIEDLRTAIDTLELQKKRAVQEHSVLLI